MPTVPGLTPEVSPSSGGTPSISVGVTADAFGGAVGHALSGLGTSIEGAGDKIWQQAVNLQNLQNETAAKNADADYMTKAGLLHAKFTSLEGENAGPEALQAHIKELQDLRTNIRGTMTNPAAAKMYDGSSLSFMGRSIFNAAGHAGQQTKVAASNASQSRVDTISDNIGENPSDEIGFQRGIRSIAGETAAQGKMHGWSEDQIEQTTSNNISTAVSKRIVGLARTDPFAAQTMFDTASKGGNLSPNDAQRVQATIQTQSRQVVSRNVSMQVNADLNHPDDGEPRKSLEDRIAEAEANPDVQRFAKNDPFLTDFVKQRVIADFNRSKAVQRDADQQNEQTVAGALMTGNKEGILPKSVDELKLINPDVSTAWDGLKPTTQRKYMAALANNAKGEPISWTSDGLKTYQSLKGQAYDDPVAFLAHDVTEDKIPNSAKREIINLQQRLKNQSEADPRVTRALQMLGPDMGAAGIDKKSDVEGYRQFVGSLQDQLDQFQKDNKKVPKLEDIRKIGAQLMQQQVTSKGYLWDSKSPTYGLPMPEEEATRLRADPYWAKNRITPNDEMLARIYRAEKFKELYGGAAKKPAEAQFPPNAPVSQ